MLVKVTRLTNPTDEPVTLDEVKRQLRIETSNTDDDDLLEDLIKAAREKAENFCNTYFCQCEASYIFDKFPDNAAPLQIDAKDVQSIDSVSYLDADNAEVAMVESTDFTVDYDRMIILPVDAWPEYAVEVMVQMTIGVPPVTGSPVGQVPYAVKQAVLIYVADLYEIRNEKTGLQIYNNKAAESLLMPYRVGMGL